MALTKDAQRGIWEARRDGMTDATEIVAYARAKYDPAESDDFLVEYVDQMPAYRKSEHPVGGWVRKGTKTYTATKVSPAEEMLHKLQADKSLTEEEKAPLMAKLAEKIQLAAEEAKKGRIQDYLAKIEAL